WRVDIPFKGKHPYIQITPTEARTLVVLTVDVAGKERPVVRTLNLASGKELKKTELTLPANARSHPILSPDGTSIATATSTGTLRLDDIDSGQKLQIAIPQQQRRIQC